MDMQLRRRIPRKASVGEAEDCGNSGDAWEADVLPLNYTRDSSHYRHLWRVVKTQRRKLWHSEQRMPMSIYTQIYKVVRSYG